MLDQPDPDPDELARSLEDLEAVNRWLGGYRVLRQALAPLRELDEASEPVRILDVGTGDGATLLHLRRWAPPGWRFVGVELSPRIAAVARRRLRASGCPDPPERGAEPTSGTARPGPPPRIQLLRGDGLQLPFADDSFHAAVCTLTLHHFDDDTAVDLVREMARVAARKVVVNDLERSTLHYLGARILAATVWRNSPVTRHDGPLSVRRSFTRDELRSIGASAGLGVLRVARRFLFRLLLEGTPGADGGDGADAEATRKTP